MKLALRNPVDFSKYRLLAPGPVQLSPQVLAELAKPMIHHRTPQFVEIFARVLSGLKHVFQTQEHVFVMSATGSGGMEIAVSNCFSPGDEVLVVVSGKFGERWAEMCETYGLKTVRLNVSWGEALKLDEFERALDANPKVKGVFTQACETSTGVMHPVREMAQLVRSKPNTIFVLDAITAIGATQLKMDDWGLDVVVAGSQKAFMLPTGLTMIALSEKAWGFYMRSKSPKYYFDLGRERKSNDAGESFVSASVSLIRALNVVLEQFAGTGLDQNIERCRALSRATHKGLELYGLQSYAKSPSPSLTAIKVPSSIDGQKWRGNLEKSYSITVMGGQDQLKGKIIRLGHLGYITSEDQLHAMAAIGLSLMDLGDSNVTLAKVDQVIDMQREMLKGF